jgi:hypothetical protein
MLSALRHHSSISGGSAYVGVTAAERQLIQSKQIPPLKIVRIQIPLLGRWLAVGFFLGKLWGIPVP